MEEEEDESAYAEEEEEGDVGFGGNYHTDPFFLTSRKKGRKRVRGVDVHAEEDQAAAGGEGGRAAPKQFWVRFDAQVMLKSHLELLNISLSGTEHVSVALLNANSRFVSREEAFERLTRDSSLMCVARDGRATAHVPLPVFSDSSASAGSSGAAAAAEREGGRSKRRKSSSLRESVAALQQPVSDGYFAHVFDIDDIDEVWRSMVSAHVIGQGRLGDVFELRACAGSSSGVVQPFDMLGSLSRHRRHPCVALVVPCERRDEALLVVGKALTPAPSCSRSPSTTGTARPQRSSKRCSKTTRATTSWTRKRTRRTRAAAQSAAAITSNLEQIREPRKGAAARGTRSKRCARRST